MAEWEPDSCAMTTCGSASAWLHTEAPRTSRRRSAPSWSSSTPFDELVVVDDASPDATAQIVAGIDDARIVLVHNSVNLGYVRTFERALMAARGQYLFLADQDDVWLPGRLDAMLDALARCAVVSTSVSVLGDPASTTALPIEGKRLGAPPGQRRRDPRRVPPVHGLRHGAAA